MERANDRDTDLADRGAPPARSVAVRAKRLVVPLALTVVTLGAVASLGGALASLAGAGCGDSSHVDAGVDSAFDATPDTPIV